MHVIATAGHVDHGKSMLVRALTGMEPDRWEAERRRGMTIDLGFAWMTLPSSEEIAFVDVPGHERFITNMLAGAGPAAAVMFVVAADEGWMPQSAEHLAAIDALGVRNGVLVVTRADLADPVPALRQAALKIAETSLGGMEAVAVSALAGEGMPDLVAALGRLAARLPQPDLRGGVRLWLDRVFAVKGIGTVVTGTLQAGTVRAGDELMLTPAMRTLRIRGVQSLGAPAAQVSGVARVALNLRGVSTRELSRGMALIHASQWTVASVIDVRLTRHPPADRQPPGIIRLPSRLAVHIGAARAVAGVRMLGSHAARLSLDHPLPLHVGDRVLLRDPGAAADHVGGRPIFGATVLDVLPPRLRGNGAAAAAERELASWPDPPTAADLLRRHRLLRASTASAMGLRDLPPPVSGEWLADPAYWQRLRQLLATAVAAHAARDPLRGLGIDDAAALLESAVPGTLDPRVRNRILAESDGNPLALPELPRALTAAELAFGTASRARSTAPLVNRLEQGFIRQLEALPQPSRQLLLAAAAEPVGDVPLLWRAAQRLGIGADAAATAESAGLIELRDRVRFRHPLVRSAVYRSAIPAQRREVHRALADATDPDLDPDRRAWHRACAAVGPDEDVAAELERSADRAVSLGGLAAAAAFLETAAALTPDPARRAQRSLDAGQAKAIAGAFGTALSLLADAGAGPLDEAGRARIDLLRAQISYNSIHGNQALPLLLAAARRLEPLDGSLARGTYLDALSAALFAGRLASGSGPGMRQVAEAVREAPPPQAPGKADLLIEGMAVLYTDGYAASAPLMHRAVQAFGSEDLTLDEVFRSVWVAAVAAVDLWDDVHWDVLSQRHLDAVRKAGALSLLPLALASRAIFDTHSGNLAAAAALVAESQWVAEATGGENTLTPISEAWLAAMRGHEKQAEQLIQDTLNDATARGQGVGLNMMYSARAVLCNGLGRYEDALAAAREAATDPLELGPTKWALAELIEAGVRSGSTDAAAGAFEQLSAMTRASGTELALGIEAARGALLRDDNTAEELYREALDRLGHTRIRVELARAQLLYGEWLRRQGRRVDARAQLRMAHETLAAMGVDAFADRARRELRATGETVRKRTAETHGELTAQETHIARLAAEGLTNPEIAAELYLSPRTVEWHLRKIFTKLGVSTRRQLRRLAYADRKGMSG